MILIPGYKSISGSHIHYVSKHNPKRNTRSCYYIFTRLKDNRIYLDTDSLTKLKKYIEDSSVTRVTTKD